MATKIHFEATLLTVGASTILRLPASASEKLPSRGQVAVKGKIGSYPFETVLEPDGHLENPRHWMRVGEDLQKAVAGEAAAVEIEIVEGWPEPQVPRDLEAALSGAPSKVRALWKDITPMARWEWVRWVNATKDPGTRKRRVEVAVSKMKSGKRRPCCFNLAAYTDPNLSKNGRLIDEAEATSRAKEARARPRANGPERTAARAPRRKH